MKRHIAKIISALSALAIVLIFSVSSAALNKSPISKPCISSNNRCYKADTGLPTEVVKDSSPQDKSRLINSKSKNILKYFNVDYSDIKSVKVINNNDLNIIERRAEIGNACVDFDTDGNIVQFINYNDMTTVNNDKNRKGGEPLPKEKYTINSARDLSSIINDMETVNNLQGYKLVDCSNNIIGAWSLTWDKDLGNGLINPYDVATCSIDAKDGSVMVFDRSTDISNLITPITTTPTVTKDEAIKFAQPVISKLGNAKKINADLTVTKPDFYWKDGGPYKRADFVRLAWKVTVNNNAIIMIDAQTGEILGGDQIK